MFKKTAVHTIFILITTLKRIHCCKSWFSLKDKGPVNNIPSSTFSPKKQQRCNLALILCLRLISWGRVIVCVRYGTNYAQKQCLGGKKTARFCSRQCPKQNEIIQKKKKSKIHGRLIIWILALPRDGAWRTCHLMGRNLAIFLAQ